METTVKERLVAYLKNKGINNSEFGRIIGVSNAYISSIRKSIQPDKMSKITENFPDLNMNWLLTGEGDMLRSDSAEPSPRPQKSYTRGVPYYNVDFIAGFDIVTNDQTVTPEYLIDFRPYEKATCWCNITGHSMEPEINSGDIIALQLIEDPTFIPYGEIYAIVTTNDMRTVKRIGPADEPGYVNLIPTNKAPEYGIQKLPISMIAQLYKVLGCMKQL